jgi:hypothetical protein
VVLAAVLLLVAGVVLFRFDPARYRFYPVCIFHQTTGLLCPGCGSLRAAHQLLHGHLLAALHDNALLVLSLPPLVWLGARLARRQIKGELAAFTVRPAWLWFALVLFLAFGILRNLPVSQLAVLAPRP